MNCENENKIMPVNGLIFEYEVMSQKGTVVFYEETVFNDIINYYEEASDYDKALDVVQDAISHHKNSINFYLKKADILFNTGKKVQALEALDIADAIMPTMESSLLRVEYLQSLNRHNEALKFIGNQQNYFENSCDLVLAKADIYEELGEYNKMYDALSQALYINPKSNDALERLMLCVEITGKFEESIQLHKKLTDISPYSHLVWYNLGLAYSSAGANNEAAEAFEYAFLIEKEFEPAYQECATVLLKLQRYAEAKDCLLEVMRITTPDSNTMLQLGQCHSKLGDLDNAIYALHQALILCPQEHEAHYQLGVIYAQLEAIDLAMQHFYLAIKINENLEEYHLELAKAYWKKGDLVNADESFLKAIETAPEVYELWIDRIQFLMETESDVSVILEAIEDAELNIESTKLNYLKAMVYYSEGKKSKAYQLLNIALQEDYSERNLLKSTAMKEDSQVLALLKLHKPI